MEKTFAEDTEFKKQEFENAESYYISASLKKDNYINML